MAETFDVTDQVAKKVIGPSGQLNPVVVVYFTTKPHGLVGNVEIPQAQATPENVRQVVCDKVAQMLAIQSL